jgi:hypothetical protein
MTSWIRIKVIGTVFQTNNWWQKTFFALCAREVDLKTMTSKRNIFCTLSLSKNSDSPQSAGYVICVVMIKTQ